LGQGLTILVSPIKFTSKHSKVIDVAAAPQFQGQNQQLTGTKKAVYWQKAKELSHTAYHLREQGKSLRKSIGEAKPQDKAQLNQKLDGVRNREKVVALQRKEHAALQQQSKQANIGQPEVVAQTRLATVSYREQFYQALVKSVAQTLCHQAKFI
jgi:hypothetical protein